jgi:AcrR family transcriptional regulator
MTDPRRSRTKQKILSAAYALFARHGYQRVTVEQILVEAGLARATFYVHFPDKQHVALTIIDEMWKRAETLYANFPLLPAVNVRTVRGWLEEVAAQWEQHHHEISFLIEQMPEELISGVRQHEERLVDQLLGDGRHWPMPRDEARCIAALLIFQIERGMQDMFNRRWLVERDLLLDTLAGIWVRSITAAGSPGEPAPERGKH